MSVHIFLVEWILDSDNAYIDGKSHLIRAVTVPSYLFEKLATAGDGVKSSQLQVFEDEARLTSFQIDCYLPDDVARLRDDVRRAFVDALRQSAGEVGSVSAAELDIKQLEPILHTFETLTSLDALLTQKLELFRDDERIVVRVDTDE